MHSARLCGRICPCKRARWPYPTGPGGFHTGQVSAERIASGCLSVVAVICAAVAGFAEASAEVASSTPALEAVPVVLLAVSALSWALVGAVIAWHRPRNVLGWMLLTTGVITQAGVAHDALGRAGTDLDEVTGVALSFAAGLMLYLTIGLLALLYPSGRIRGRSGLVAGGIVVAGAVAQQAQWLWAQYHPRSTWAFGDASDVAPAWVLLLPAGIYFGGVVLGWVLCVVRLTRAAYPERQQLAWLLLSVAFLLATMFLGESTVALWLQSIAVPLLPAAIAVGVLRYRLLGIETALPRTVTYVVLTVFATAVYLAATAWAGAQLTGAVVPAVIATAVLSVGLLPLRERVERIVGRFLYGTRTDPAGAVADLGRTVADADASRLLEESLGRVAATFRARGAVLFGPDSTERARVGAVEPVSMRAPLVVAGSHVGEIGLVPRRPGEPFSRRDADLFGAVAPQLALLSQAVGLADLLQTQRDAVLAATAGERDRIRRDLHDELGPSLTGIGLGLRGAADALDAEQVERARDITAVLAHEVERAVLEVRRVLDDLRPADLVVGDLEAALRRRARTAPSTVPVHVSVCALPPLSADVEDAVYRVVSEAMTNALRHADADGIAVDVGVQADEVVAKVVDDGRRGVAPAETGIGVASMRERARAVGGHIDIDTDGAGTTVTLRIPVGSRA